MATGVSFVPELRPISGTGIVPIKIKNPRGGLITILEIDPSKTTVGELKQMLQKQSTFESDVALPILPLFAVSDSHSGL